MLSGEAPPERIRKYGVVFQEEEVLIEEAGRHGMRQDGTE